MNGGRFYRSSAPVNGSRKMGEYQNREAVRVMGYHFERPSNMGVIVRRATPAEMAARDTAIEALREERGAMERARDAQMRSEAYFAAARIKAIAAMARCARLRKRSGRKVWQRKGGE